MGGFVQKIVFFDGVCVMCNGLVDFALKHDKKHIFYFAPLQGKTAQEKIPLYAQNLNTIVVLDEQGLSTESDAIIRLFSSFGGIFALAKLLKIIPKSLRDRLYRFIAKNRYRWFGQKSCALPDAHKRSKILE